MLKLKCKRRRGCVEVGVIEETKTAPQNDQEIISLRIQFLKCGNVLFKN